MISKAKLENYFTILAIIETNLEEYVFITDKIKFIQAAIKVTIINKELNNSLNHSNDNVKPESDVELIGGDALTRLTRKVSSRNS
jgi:hypothetical protein